MSYFNENDIQRFHLEFSQIEEVYLQISLKWLKFSEKLTPNAKEYLAEGFLRRLGILKSCLENIYTIYPIEKKRTDLLNDKELDNIIINVQSFIINIFGCLDNLAWILVKEKNLNLSRMQVDFQHKKFKSHLSENFKNYMNNRKNFFETIKDFRDALAHRISPYMPLGIDPDTSEFVNFPILTHSTSEESKPLILHPQLIIIWKTLIEFSDKFLEELKTNIRIYP